MAVLMLNNLHTIPSKKSLYQIHEFRDLYSIMITDHQVDITSTQYLNTSQPLHVVNCRTIPSLDNLKEGSLLKANH